MMNVAPVSMTSATAIDSCPIKPWLKNRWNVELQRDCILSQCSQSVSQSVSHATQESDSDIGCLQDGSVG